MGFPFRFKEQCWKIWEKFCFVSYRFATMKLENSRRIELVSISFWKDRVGKCRGNLMPFHIVFEELCCCFSEVFHIVFLSSYFHIVSYRFISFISFHIVSYRLVSFHIVFLWFKPESFDGFFRNPETAFAKCRDVLFFSYLQTFTSGPSLNSPVHEAKHDQTYLNFC